MINKKYLKNLRSKEINNKNNFIFDIYNERIIDAIDVITIDFKNILILGDNGSKIYEYLRNRYNQSTITVNDIKLPNYIFKSYENFNKKSIEIDLWAEQKNKYDLILSNFYLNLSDNIEIILKKILASLTPNGFFIATLPSPENFSLLKSSMIKTDIQLYDGVYNRFNRTNNVQDIIKILKKYNFKIPIVDSEKIILQYKKFKKLLSDVRSMSMSYYFVDKKKTFEKKTYFKILENNYVKNQNNYFELVSDIYIISGWKEHSSHQKPIKPGEAETNLKDFLNNQDL